MDAPGHARRRHPSPWRRLLLPIPSPTPSPDSDLIERDVLWSRNDPDPQLRPSSDDDTQPPAPRTTSLSSRSIPIAPKKTEPDAARSAPINIPMRGRWREAEGEDRPDVKEDEGGVEEWMPPHEIVAKTWGNRNPACYSVVEGAGRTLKGRDLRRVRNAVWRQTGFH